MLLAAGYSLKRILGLLLFMWTYIGCQKERDNTGHCDFPQFIWTPIVPNEQGQKLWYTRSEYAKNTQTLTREREIVASKTEFTTRIILHEMCEDYVSNTSFPCSKARVKSRTLCVGMEQDGKYRVQIQENEKSIYTCMKFIQRGKNIVQIWSAMPKDYNEASLCRENFLKRDSWPWIADGQQDWSFCPLTGGYSFRANLNGERDICKNEWSPSRVESECISGEGMQFIFQKPKCSFFPTDPINTAVMQLYCWGSWEEDEYIFTLLAKEGQRPQLVFRLPKNYGESETFAATLNYNPVCTLKGGGRPSKESYYLSLEFKRNDPGLCFDESEKCAEFAREGKCSMMKLHEFATHCKKSCGLCGDTGSLTPSGLSECVFPDEYLGNWSLFEDVLMEHVLITSGQISFAKLGTYICKGKHWEKNMYKMFSMFNNGCRPRYTCFKFRRDGKALLYQMSKSVPGDQSFDMCQFKDDPQPLGNRIRSESLKILLPTESTKLNSCGLSGKIEIDVTFKDGQSCSGTISDWDFNRCAPSPHMELYVHPCHMKYKDFHCVAYTTLSNGVSVLITDEKDNHGVIHYSCWMIKSYVEGKPDHPWSNAFLLPGAQCGSSRWFSNVEQENPLLTVTSKVHPDSIYYTNHIQKPCYQAKPTQKSGDMIISAVSKTTTTSTTTESPYITDINTPPLFQNDNSESGAPKYGISIEDITPPISQNKRNKDRLLRHSTKNNRDSPLKSSAVGISFTTRPSTFIIAFVLYKLYANCFIS